MSIITKIKRFALWSLFGLLLTWVVSCGGASTSNSPELEFWTMQLQPEFTEYFNDLIAKFEAENQGVKVRWVDVPWSAMESKILTAVSAKTAPDVVNLNPNFASQLATRNAWLDLNKQVSAEVKQEYLANIWDASAIADTSFGFPWYLTTRVTIYNQNLLQQADVNQAPTTYAELAAVAEKVKEKTGKYAFFATFVPNDSGEVLESLVQMNVDLVAENGKAAFNTPEGVAAFQYWVDLYQKKLLPPEVLTQGHRYGIELYQAGETAFLASGAEFLKTIANNAPQIAEVSVAAPQITGETGKKNVAVMNLVIPRDTEQPEAALKFAEFVTNTENQLAFAEAANVLPSTNKALEMYIEKIEEQENATTVEEARKVSAMQIKDAEVLVPAMENLNQLQKAIYENLQAAMLGEKTVEQAVADAAETWNQIS
ncbi:MAG: sugar ABC transporter substrate-binding protein [Oscillatoria sp. PMC 1068.18]|nr:sugar ABC transporter substrate-binding protein [Oscillatoria sp. PMC 1076.18]MEC4988202.1 sugar ABC transporter substrate-binding protein [Oscillatoria sp. PMC 1068.18]